MLARRWYQHSKLIQQLQECWRRIGLPIGPGFWETINQPPVLLLDLPCSRSLATMGRAQLEQAFQLPGATQRCDSLAVRLPLIAVIVGLLQI